MSGKTSLEAFFFYFTPFCYKQTSPLDVPLYAFGYPKQVADLLGSVCSFCLFFSIPPAKMDCKNKFLQSIYLNKFHGKVLQSGSEEYFRLFPFSACENSSECDHNATLQLSLPLPYLLSPKRGIFLDANCTLIW